MRDKNAQAEKTISSHWAEIANLFKARSAFSLRSIFGSGITPRLSFKRIDRLRKLKRAKNLFTKLEAMTSKDIKAIRTYAAINQEQAVAAFRFTMVSYVTLPVGFMAVMHQLLPTGIGGYLAQNQAWDEVAFVILIWTLALTVLVTGAIAIYALANLSQARDIRHLVDLYAAERGIYFGLEDMDDLSLT